MLHKTRGIVFRLTKYGETSIIVSIFTEAFGLQSYIVNGVRSKSSKNKIALYQPLTLLDMVVYHREHGDIMRIKEIHCAYPYHSLPMDMRKSSLAIFINEIINKTVKDQSHAQELCDFLFYSLMSLDAQTAGVENFHLIFLLKLSRFLGFGAQQASEVLGFRIASESVEQLLQQLLDADYGDVLTITNDQRRELMELILKFYADHIETLGEVRSIQVLREILG